MATPQGTIILKQPVLDGIADEDILPALAEALQKGPREAIEIDIRESAKRAIETGDWDSAARELTRSFRERLRPAMDAHPGWRVAYFGTAPIPLAMQLGFLTSTWATVDTFLRHHVQRNWLWSDSPAHEPELRVRGLPQELVRAEGDAIIRISATLPVEPRDTLEVVPDPLAEVDIEIEPMGYDAVVSMTVLERVADAFRDALDAILNRRPGIRTVHVFAAVPVGVAFRMGTRVSPTMHPRVQTYYFNRNATPRHISAIALQDDSTPRARLSVDERKRTTKERKRLVRDVERLRTFAGTYGDWQTGRADANWLSFVLPDVEARAPFQCPWESLPAITSTPLVDSTIDAGARNVEDGFRFDETKRAWQLGDELVAAISNYFEGEEERSRAIRMLLLHEGVHAGHRLTRATSVRIGRFPKLLEEVDYQADVWTMLHEYALTRQGAREAVKDSRMFFLNLIQTAINTYWAFDAGSGPLYEIQIRRLNRYLIWYWQYLRMERARSLVDAAAILAHRPLLELAGPSVIARGERIFYRLDPLHVDNMELGVLYKNSIHRFGAGLSIPLHSLLDGIRARDGDRVKEVLRGAFAQLEG
ncbi:SAVED domain-containing protein [Sorangium sp. So ce590]|uniref:SAVED domain-containing protein n=1 Tax=Sorangium sp. So ce590 TaxID=3133317 RepID=UPI003F639646